MAQRKRRELCRQCNRQSAELGTSHCIYCARHLQPRRIEHPAPTQLSFDFEDLRYPPRLLLSRMDNLRNRAKTFGGKNG